MPRSGTAEFYGNSIFVFLRKLHTVSISPVQSLSRVRLSVTPWTAARQASLSTINSRSPPKPMSKITTTLTIMLPYVPVFATVRKNDTSLLLQKGDHLVGWRECYNIESRQLPKRKLFTVWRICWRYLFITLLFLHYWEGYSTGLQYVLTEFRKWEMMTGNWKTG